MRYPFNHLQKFLITTLFIGLYFFAFATTALGLCNDLMPPSEKVISSDDHQEESDILNAVLDHRYSKALSDFTFSEYKQSFSTDKESLKSQHKSILQTVQGAEFFFHTDTLCDDDPPIYFNHAQVLCSEKAVLDYCMLMGPPTMNFTWPGCSSCCAFHNPNWMVFIAGNGPELSLEIEITHCSQLNGVQLAMYDLGADVDFTDIGGSPGLYPVPEMLVTSCDLASSPQKGTVNISTESTPGHFYGIVFDGWANDQCQISVNKAVNIGYSGEFELDSPLELEMGGIEYGFTGDTLCLGARDVKVELSEEVEDATAYRWEVNGQLIQMTDFHYAEFEFTEEGEQEVCVRAIRDCDLSDEICITLYITPWDSTSFEFQSDTVCFNESYVWTDENGEFIETIEAGLEPGLHFSEKTRIYNSEGCPLIIDHLELLKSDSIHVTFETSDANCDGENNGSISNIQISGSFPPYDVSLSSVDSTELAPGNYQIFIEDDFGCQVEKPFQIKEIPGPTIEIIEIKNSAMDENTGYAEVEVSGGTEPYSYHWMLDGQVVSEDLILENAGPNEYTFIAEDDNGCIDSISLRITYYCDEDPPYYYNHAQVLCSEEAALNHCMVMGPPTMNFTWPGCSDCCAFHNPNWIVFIAGDGPELSLEIEISNCSQLNGVQLAMYDLGTDVDFTDPAGSPGLYPVPEMLVTSCDLASSPQIGTVSISTESTAGHFYGVVVDGWAHDQCQVSIIQATNVGYSEEFTLDSLPELEMGGIEYGFSGDTLCLGARDVKIELSEEVEDATAYRWEVNGQFIQMTDLHYAEFEFTEEGVQEVCVRAMRNCDLSDEICRTLYISPWDSTSVEFQTDNICYNESYVWTDENGEFIETIEADLLSGLHFFEKTFYNSEGCPLSIHHLELLKSDSIHFTFETSDVSCFGGNDGVVLDYEISGGIAPVHFETELDSLHMLEAGFYNYQITDSIGCEVLGYIEIEEPPELQIEIVELGPSGEMNNEGYIIIEIEGGTAPYQYEWYLDGNLIAQNQNLFELAAGVYTLIVKDAHDCEVMEHDITVEIDVSSSEQLEIHGDVGLFPNPVYDRLTVVSDHWRGEFQMSIYNTLGQRIHEGTVFLDGEASIDVGHLSPGSYFFHLTKGEREVVYKILKK